MVWKCVHAVAPVYLSDLCVPATTISGRQHILRSAATELYWFHAPRLQLDNEVSQSTNQPQGTVCHQHSGHHGHAGERLQASTEDAPVLDRPAPLRRLHDSGVEYIMYKCPDLLTYLQ